MKKKMKKLLYQTWRKGPMLEETLESLKNSLNPDDSDDDDFSSDTT